MEAFNQALAANFMPHGHCYLWRPSVLWLHVISDATIALAYYSIPIALVYVARRRPDFRLGWVLVLFGAFILLCGTTHVMEIVTVWHPYYYSEGILKGLTAVVSLFTAAALWPLVPVVLKIPSTQELEARNLEMQRQVTERERAETALTKSNEELEQFAYIVSHDLTEPLRMIGSYTQLLERRYADQLDDEAKKFINYAVDGSRRMQEMLQDLLEYSRVGRAEIEFEPVALGKVCEEAVRDLGRFIEERNAVVEFGKLPTVKGSAGLLRQLFQNLINNGIKYNETEQPRVQISVENGPLRHRIVVLDNGIGLDVQFAERIFVPFQRLHTRSKYQGSGVGLALAKRVVERHGGRLSVESEPAKGARFIVDLP